MTRKNLDDRNLAYSHLEAYVQAHTPEVFNPRNLQKIHQAKLCDQMVYYALLQPNTNEGIREEIISTGQKMDRKSAYETVVSGQKWHTRYSDSAQDYFELYACFITRSGC